MHHIFRQASTHVLNCLSYSVVVISGMVTSAFTRHDAVSVTNIGVPREGPGGAGDGVQMQTAPPPAGLQCQANLFSLRA